MKDCHDWKLLMLDCFLLCYAINDCWHFVFIGWTDRVKNLVYIGASQSLSICRIWQEIDLTMMLLRWSCQNTTGKVINDCILQGFCYYINFFTWKSRYSVVLFQFLQTLWVSGCSVVVVHFLPIMQWAGMFFIKDLFVFSL